MDYFLQAGFVDRHFSGLQDVDFARIVVDAQNVVTDVGKASSGNKADVTGTND